MYVVCVTVHVKADCVESFLQATLANARDTRKEPGNVRFDVLQAIDDPTRFSLYEAYRSKDDFDAHHENAHYLAWREAVADCMAQPRQALKCKSVFFGDCEG